MSASASAVPGGRLLIAEFDSQAQAHVFAAAPDPRAAISELTQRLRVGTIVASRVVLTDAMVLDGSYFLTLGPEGVIRELGASVAELPLLVVGRARSLTEALEHRRSRPDHLWASAGLVASREWDPPENVLRSWERWTDAAASGVVSYRAQRDSAGSPMRFGELPDVDRSAADCVASLRVTAVRSVAEAVIAGHHLSARDRAALHGWWSDAYLRMIAENVGADWMSFHGSRAARLEERPGTISLSLPERLKTWAEVATPGAFGEARAATETHRVALLRKPSAGAMRNLAFVAMRTPDRPTRWHVRLSAATRIAVAAVLILCATPFVPWLAPDGPLAWVVFALAVATTIPYAAFRDISRLATPEPSAVLTIHAREEASNV